MERGSSTIRPGRPGDRRPIRRILEATAVFTEDQIESAMALVDRALAEGEAEYVVFVAEEDNREITGYVCFGPVPKSSDAWDLYWIAVAPPSQNRGVGRTLVSFVEEEAGRRGASQLLIETSAGESYRPARRFYERNGYREETRIIDIRRIGDERVVFSKKIR